MSSSKEHLNSKYSVKSRHAATKYSTAYREIDLPIWICLACTNGQKGTRKTSLGESGQDEHYLTLNLTKNISDTIISDLTLNESTVLAALKAPEVGKATEPDKIPAKLLKETASVIAPSLCKIFNKSLQLGSLSSNWKLAIVVPVHKKGAKDHVENYRPISLLPIVSKVLQRCVLNSIKDHLYQVTTFPKSSVLAVEY